MLLGEILGIGGIIAGTFLIYKGGIMLARGTVAALIAWTISASVPPPAPPARKTPFERKVENWEWLRLSHEIDTALPVLTTFRLDLGVPTLGDTILRDVNTVKNGLWLRRNPKPTMTPQEYYAESILC